MPALLPITIRPEHPTDHAATEALALAAFAPDERGAELVRSLRHSPALIAEVNLVAQVEREALLVGHLMVSRAIITSGHTLALLSPLGVLPGYQRQGVGAALVKGALTRLRQLSFPVVVLEGAPNFYPRLGFGSAYALEIAPPYPLPTAVWQAYRLPAYQGTERGKLTYPPAFDFLHTTG